MGRPAQSQTGGL